MPRLSPSKLILVAGVPFAGGMLLSSLAALRSEELPLLVFTYFVGAALMSAAMQMVWRWAAGRRLELRDDEDDSVLQQLVVAVLRQGQTSQWYLKLGGVCLVAWGVLVATR